MPSQVPTKLRPTAVRGLFLLLTVRLSRRQVTPTPFSLDLKAPQDKPPKPMLLDPWGAGTNGFLHLKAQLDRLPKALLLDLVGGARTRGFLHVVGKRDLLRT